MVPNVVPRISSEGAAGLLAPPSMVQTEPQSQLCVLIDLNGVAPGFSSSLQGGSQGDLPAVGLSQSMEDQNLRVRISMVDGGSVPCTLDRWSNSWDALPESAQVKFVEWYQSKFDPQMASGF